MGTLETEHERVEEVLAARALRSLTDEEEEAAEALIRAHLPHCDACRQAQEDFESVAGELALASPSRRPPQAILSRLERDVGQPRRRLGAAGGIAVAAALIAIGLGSWSLHLTGRISRAEAQQARTAELISAVTVPNSKVVTLSRSGTGSSAGVAAVYVPGDASLYVVGSMPTPHSHRVYQVWLRRAGQYASVGTFVPGPKGIVVVRVAADVGAYDHMLITEEPAEGSARPSGQRVVESDL